MIALPSDVARAKPDVQASYQALLESMVGLFSEELKDHSDNVRQKALSLAALAVGGMILARTLPDSALAQEVQTAAMASADQIIVGQS